jgi:uncharacterized protein YuzE
VKFKRDPRSGAVYLRLREPSPEGVFETLVVDEGVYMDVDEDGFVIGIEFLSLEDFGEYIEAFPGGWEVPEHSAKVKHTG